MTGPDAPVGFDDLDIGIVVLDATRIVRGWNRWMAERSGLPAADAVGRGLFDLFPTLADGPLAGAVEKALTAGSASEVSHELPALRAPRVLLSTIAKPLNGPGGRFGCLLQAHDAGPHAGLERALAAAREEAATARAEAEGAKRAKSKFLAAATHDLRQPVQSLMLFSAALASEPEVGRGRDVLGHMDRALGALKSLSDSLLDLSKLDAGVVRVRRRAFPLSVLMDAIDAGYAGNAAAKGLGWSVRAPEVTVRSDPVLLGRVVRNLVENAIRYTPNGAVGVECAAHGSRLLIAVRDTGVGIPPESLEEIFTEFHQLANPERDQTQGLGLGLTVVRRLARLLGHPVEVRSTPGQGSVFTVDVPLDRAEAAKPEAQVRPNGAGAFAILIDDNPGILMGLRALMEQWDYALLTAESCEEAEVELARAARAPDVIVADYRLREQRTGTQAIHAIRARFGTRIPAVMLTGENSPECVRDSKTEGFTILHKPVEPEQLRRTLADAVRATGTLRPRGRQGRTPA